MNPFEEIQKANSDRKINILKGFSEVEEILKSKDENKTIEDEEKEHSDTYKKLKEDAKDGKLDTTKKEFAEEINQDHKEE